MCEKKIRTHNREHELKAIREILHHARPFKGRDFLVGKTLYKEIGMHQHAFNSVVTKLQEKKLLGRAILMKEMLNVEGFFDAVKASFPNSLENTSFGRPYLNIKVMECFKKELKQHLKELKREGLPR